MKKIVFTRNHRPGIRLLNMILLLCVINLSEAAQQSVSFKVSQKIVNGCQITQIDPINFGTLTIADMRKDRLLSTGELRIKCTPGVNLQILLDGGQHASTAQRRMATPDGKAYLLYNLYQDVARQKPWPVDSPYKPTVSDYANISVPLYAEMITPANAPIAEKYSDVIGITISY
ncbi:hypothetical protein BL250_15150 [Erwinia sp. OLTSP20]|uniref:Csu type fimbrial protein n=1 Tax=unclassified Erwinia TaxID=2622719 RepID=UPI000C4B9D8A|nr:MULTISPECIES: spore coat U domain-containing protein [unclassified Erwinia]PIJ48480.1 hypothetical protein BV501_16945 [Erwinia sp. OAMSP11]PIJ75976.1 hypothetical protein BK416_00350 [Erwinia sp. OLSSP12]PIJ78876.1 hypothetical protein BLD47_16295 [Erwinia sp. OLCASP19]PIJ87434.1 hypothetical protein BLD46_00360 [Erwinia sp. OLMTSP26]PIJ88984.1 hypothetical protein BLD49_00360 [Erwinia sp. OLMDSP33]